MSKLDTKIRDDFDSKPVKVNSSLAQTVLAVVDRGLSRGLGNRKPGQMCVEAAVAYASGEPHNDRPTCVDYELSVEKINLNDQEEWGSNKARAKGLRRLAIAQLGSRDKFSFSKYGELMQEHFTPMLLEGYKLVLQSRVEERLKHLKARAKILIENGSYPSTIVDCLNDEMNDFCIEDNFKFVSDCESAIDALEHAFPNKKPAVRLQMVADGMVEVLKKMKVPGTKYLYLTDKKAKKAKKSKRK